MFWIAVLAGCFVGISVSYWITITMVEKSNDHGDSKGEFKDFVPCSLQLLRANEEKEQWW